MLNIDFYFVKQLLSKKSNIIITTHKSPDGDALGSSLALFHSLKHKHNVRVIVPNNYPDYFNWMPGNNKVLIYEGNEDKCDIWINNADIIFFLDLNKLYRTHTMSVVLRNSQAYKIMIDHHEEPEDFCDQTLSDPNICSTAELIFAFLSKMEFSLNKSIAICLYTGIITDSGSLRYPNVTSETHLKTAELMSFGINHSMIHQNLFDSQNKSRLDLLKVILINLKIFKKEKTAITFLMESDLINYNYKKGDTEGFVNLPLSIKGIVFSAFFIQFEDGIKMSFRSQGNFDVNLFAKKYFNGGGHKNASGGFLKDRNVEKTIEYFSSVLKEYLLKV